LIIIRALLVTSRPDPLFPPDNNVIQIADTTFHYKAFFAELPIADFEHSNWHLFPSGPARPQLVCNVHKTNAGTKHRRFRTTAATKAILG
jgi:hypothetical protein